MESPSAERKSRLEQSLRDLSSYCHNLTGDISALSPAALERFERMFGCCPEKALSAMLAQAEGLVACLDRFMPLYWETQVESVSMTGDVRKLNVGAGGRPMDGWLNIDLYPSQLCYNLARRLPLSDSSVRYVYLSHVLEHFYYPEEARNILGEMYRLLAVGGVLRVVVPDAELLFQKYCSNDVDFFTRRRHSIPTPYYSQTLLEEFLAYLGAGPTPASFFKSHKFGYDYTTLAKLLNECGFSKIIRSEYMKSDFCDLRIDKSSLVSENGQERGKYSIFLDAVK